MKQTLILDRHETSQLALGYPYAHANCVNAEEVPSFSGDPNRKAEIIIPVYDYRSVAQALEPQNAGVDWMPSPSGLVPFAVWFHTQLANPEIEGFVVNCGVGVSRSSGLALAIERYLGHDTSYCFDWVTHRVSGQTRQRQYNPNPLMYTAATYALLSTPGIPVDWQRIRTLLDFPENWKT